MMIDERAEGKGEEESLSSQRMNKEIRTKEEGREQILKNMHPNRLTTMVHSCTIELCLHGNEPRMSRY